MFQFLDFANEIDEVSHHNARNIYGVVEGFAMAITSLSLFTDLEWPQVSFPHFDVRARQAMKTAGADFVAFAPFVSEDERQAWEEYSVANTEWISSGLSNAGISSIFQREKVLQRNPGSILPKRTIEASPEVLSWQPLVCNRTLRLRNFPREFRVGQPCR